MPISAYPDHRTAAVACREAAILKAFVDSGIGNIEADISSRKTLYLHGGR
jgi:hypothetical protein